MSLNANELLDLMEEILDGDEYIEEEDSEEEDDEYDDEEEDDEYDDDDDEDVEEKYKKPRKSIEGGHLVVHAGHNVGPRTAAQKAALKKAQKMSHKGGANKNRRKSMNVRRRKGL